MNPARAEAGLAQRVAAAARQVADVVALSSGPYATVRTVLPEDTVEGVSLHPSRVEVGVTVRWGRTLPEIATDVRAAVAAVVPDRAVDVTIADVLVDQPNPASH